MLHQEIAPTITDPKEIDNMVKTVTAQGNKVRELKSNGASKEEVNIAVAALLELKSDFKRATGKEFGRLKT